MDALFLAELNERLFVHFIDGRWRVPQDARLIPSLPLDSGTPGGRQGRIACAGPAEVARARATLVAGGDADALAAAYDRLRSGLAELRRREGYDDPAAPPAPVALPCGGPLVLLSAAAVPVSVLAGVLIAGAARGVLWKPAPAAAASAHLMMRTMGPLASGALALVQGDHATGAAVAGQGALVWASNAPPPGEAALSLAARCPRRP